MSEEDENRIRIRRSLTDRDRRISGHSVCDSDSIDVGNDSLLKGNSFDIRRDCRREKGTSEERREIEENF